jgi:Histidine kinase-, DNA gyrase B-, and HSP90-like ATPase
MSHLQSTIPLTHSDALVQTRAFVEATRDSGYKSPASAIAELVDNALEAGARTIDIEVTQNDQGSNSRLVIVVRDDGSGMNDAVIKLALQFGGSTRFGSTSGFGRFGMGLPNSSLSQARRVDLISWNKRSEVWETHLDVDEIVERNVVTLPKPRKASYRPTSPSGTLVKLTKCDRLKYRDVDEAASDLTREFGRMFRQFLLSGTMVRINGTAVRPSDPLFLRGMKKVPHAKAYGPPIIYSVRVPGTTSKASVVSVTFSELPLMEWNGLSNHEKNKMGIAKGAGISVLRGGREIDHGWFFMDGKRKENYDDWWRCELSFEPDLDELFGVTHTKQGIRPAAELEEILSPDIGRIARELNSRIRRQYSAIRTADPKRVSLNTPEMKDYLLEPPRAAVKGRQRSTGISSPRSAQTPVDGLRYILQEQPSSSTLFYDVALHGKTVTITLNERHPFYAKVYLCMSSDGTRGKVSMAEYLRCVLAAAARAEVASLELNHREIILKFRKSWSDALVAFLS